MNVIFQPPPSTYKSEDFEGIIWIPKIQITSRSNNDNDKNISKGVALPVSENQPQTESSEQKDNEKDEPNNNFIPAFFQKWKGKDGEKFVTIEYFIDHQVLILRS